MALAVQTVPAARRRTGRRGRGGIDGRERCGPPSGFVSSVRKSVRAAWRKSGFFILAVLERPDEGHGGCRPDGPIAQLDRVTDFYSVGCRFESCWDRQLFCLSINGLVSRVPLPAIHPQGRRIDFQACSHDSNLIRVIELVQGLNRIMDTDQRSFAMSRRISLAVLATISALTAVASSSPADAGQDRYCLQGRQWGYPGNCQFSSYAQCMATASGTDAYCGINPQYAFAQQRRGPRQYQPYQW